MASENVEVLDVNEQNIESEDIVCVRGPQNQEGIECKKEWLKVLFKEGLRFKKLMVEGRSWGFIEYLPAEYAWKPITAPGYMFIDCVWVIGRHKGKGYGKMLLEECIRDSNSKNGVCVITGDRPFLTRKNLYLSNGFEICDTSPPYFELLVRKNREAPLPKFNECARRNIIDDEDGLVFIYSDQCPYIAKFLNVMIEVANNVQIPVRKIKVTDKNQAQGMPFAFGTSGVFYNGKLLTHEIMTEKGFTNLLKKVGAI